MDKNKSIVTQGATALAHPSEYGDVRLGGVSPEDFVIPRAMLLQAMTPELASYYPAVAGDVVSSVTKEKLSGLFIPLFPFKFYAKFDAERRLEWGTIDRTDPRVVEGLKWEMGRDGERTTEVTEILNFLTVFDDNFDVVYSLSFKRSSMGVGRRFLSRLQMGKAATAPLWAHRYAITSREIRGKKGTYFVPAIDVPREPEKRDVPSPIQVKASEHAEYYKGRILQVSAALSEDSADASEGDDKPSF